jgi:hypothetical protein
MTVPEIRKTCANPYNPEEYPDGAFGKMSFLPTDYENEIKGSFKDLEQWETFCMLPLTDEQKKEILSKIGLKKEESK